MRPSREPVLFVDRCLGKGAVASALRLAGYSVEIHDEHFAQDCDDSLWIREVTRRGWIILTKDKAIRRHEGHKQAIREAGAAAFFLTSGDRTGDQNAHTFLEAMGRIIRLCEKHTRPLLATVSASGAIKVIEGERRGGVRKG